MLRSVFLINHLQTLLDGWTQCSFQCAKLPQRSIQLGNLYLSSSVSFETILKIGSQWVSCRVLKMLLFQLSAPRVFLLVGCKLTSLENQKQAIWEFPIFLNCIFKEIIFVKKWKWGWGGEKGRNCGKAVVLYIEIKFYAFKR